MSPTSLETLFARYREDGDLAALAELFDRAAPELLRIGRHLCRSEHEAEDLVQSTFLVAIERAATWDAARTVSPWLIGILQNLRRRRGDPAELGLEAELELDRRAGEPHERAEQREVRQHVGRAIEELPSPYQEVLDAHLREGLAAPDIARRFGRRPATIHVQLHRGLKRLRRLLPAGVASGGAVWIGAPRGLAAVRRQVVAAAQPVGPGTAVTLSPLIWLGGLGMQKALIAALVALVGAGLWWGTRDRALPGELEGEVVGPVAEAAAPPVGRPGDAPAPEHDGTARAAAEEGAQRADLPAPPYGRLELRVRYADGAPAPGLRVELTPNGEAQPNLSKAWRATDADGRLVAPRVHGGELRVYVSRARQRVLLEVPPGELLAYELTLPAGVDVAGVVLDPRGAPVAGARVWASSDHTFRWAGTELAVTGADGRFAARGLHGETVLAATAPDSLRAESEKIAGLVGELELRLGEPGPGTGVGRVAGTVRGPGGALLVDAPVLLGREGEGPSRRILAQFTDERGRFAFAGLRVGRLFVLAQASGCAGVMHELSLAAGEQEELDLRIDPGATVRGRVTDSDGAPVAGAKVMQQLEFPRAFLQSIWARSGADGGFQLAGIVPGAVELVAQAQVGDKVRQTATRLELSSGVTVGWDPVLGAMSSLRGRVEDSAGVGLAAWRVQARPLREVAFYPDAVPTDAAGEFEVVDCHDVPHELAVYPPEGSAWPRATLTGVSPSDEDVVVRVLSDDTSGAWLVGRLVGPRGAPLAQGWVRAQGASQGAERVQVDAEGAFELGPLAPGEHRVELGLENRTFRVLDPLTLSAGERRELGELRYAAAGELQLVISGASGAALERPFLVLRNPFGFATIGESEDGFSFRFPDLQPATYKLLPLCADGATRAYEVVVREGETTYLELALEPGVRRAVVFQHPAAIVPPRSIDLRVLDAAGEELFGWEALADDQRAEPVQYFVSMTFAVGTYTLEARSATGASVRAELTVDSLEPSSEPLVLDLIEGAADDDEPAGDD